MNGDGRSAWTRRFRDIFESHVSDLGGLDMLSEGQVQLCRRAASIAIECERLEGELSQGNPVDVDLLGRLTGHLRRIIETIGIRREPRDVTPDLATYIRSKATAS